MPLNFPFYRQRDAMDCGPTCLIMAAAAHGRQYPLTYLRERSYLSREGVSTLGIMEAAEDIWFRTMTVKVPFDTVTDSGVLLDYVRPHRRLIIQLLIGMALYEDVLKNIQLHIPRGKSVNLF